MRSEFVCISVVRIASGPRVKLAGCKKCFKSPGGSPRLGKRELILSAFRTFVRFVLVCICRFPLPLGVWERLRFVIVALPVLFSYLFYSTDHSKAVVPVLVLLFVAL